MYKVGNIVLVRSRAGTAIPPVHVKLLKKHSVKGTKGNRMDWPEYTYWEAKLIYKKEVKMLRKRFCIPYSYPEDVYTNVFEADIIKIKNNE